MKRKQGQQDNNKVDRIWPAIFMAIALAYGYYAIDPQSDAMKAIRYICGIASLLWCWQVLKTAPSALYNHLLQKKAANPSGNYGNAQWMNRKRRRALKLDKPEGFFIGCAPDGGEGLWVKVKAFVLVIGSTGIGKTACLVVNNLFHDINSAFVLDAKRTLLDITWHARHTIHKQDIYLLDLTGATPPNPKIKPICYNPLTIVIDAYRQGNEHQVIRLSRMVAECFCPVPKGTGDSKYFYEGSQGLLIFLILALSVRQDTTDSNLPEALAMVQDDEYLISELHNAICSDALNGDLARKAKDLLRVYEEKNSTHWQSFCSGVVQALSDFGKSTHLAKITRETTLSLSELKTRKITLYLQPDLSNKKASDKFLTLLSSSLKHELMEYEQNANDGKPAVPVSFYLDEIANITLKPLIESAMEIREFGFKLYMFIQSLAGFEQTYSKETLKTLLDQCELKIFMGVVSEEIASLLSRMLGNHTVITDQYSLGHEKYDTVRMSSGEAAKPLLAIHEILQTKDGIALINGEKSMRFTPVPYSQITPYRKWQGINRFFGKKYKERVRLKLRYPSRWSWRGMFGLFKPKPYVIWHKKVKLKRKSKNIMFRLIYLYSLLLPWTLIAAIWWGIETYGLPHMLWRYDNTTCEYLDFMTFTTKYTINPGECPLFEVL